LYFLPASAGFVRFGAASALRSFMQTPATIHYLFDLPASRRREVASLIHHEFWTEVPGASVEKMEARLAQGRHRDALPLTLVALVDDELRGVVNLVDNDDDVHTDWLPWLAGMVVAAPWRGQGIGSALARRLLDEARRMGYTRVYFGTDGPAFYTRLGAVLHEQVRADFQFMRFDLGAAASAPGLQG
jgi:predicted N-acetyltransferase YhbS